MTGRIARTEHEIAIDSGLNFSREKDQNSLSSFTISSVSQKSLSKGRSLLIQECDAGSPFSPTSTSLPDLASNHDHHLPSFTTRG